MIDRAALPVCGEKGAIECPIELDHVCPVSRSFAGQPQQLQPLCAECHREKTASQTTPIENPLASVLHIDTYDFLCNSPKPKALVFAAHPPPNEDCLLLDIRRCRRNCMAQSPYPIPILSCLGCVQPFTGEIRDFKWLEKSMFFLPAAAFIPPAFSAEWGVEAQPHFSFITTSLEQAISNIF